MAVIKRYNLKGLATKIDDLYKSPDYATDCRNVVKDCSGRIIGRDGLVVSAPVLASTDMYYSPEKQEHYSFNGSTIKKSTDGVNFTDIPKYFTGSLNNSLKSFSENSGYLFFSDTQAVDEIMKYDGYGIYQAGLPKLDIAAMTSTTNGDYFGVLYTTGSTQVIVKACMYSIGAFGDIFYGPMSTVKFSSNGGIPAFSMPTIKRINEIFLSKYNNRVVVKNAIVSVINGTITFTDNVSTNYVAGDYLKLVGPDDQVIYSKIVEIVAKTIKVEDSISGSYGIGATYGGTFFASNDGGLTYYFITSIDLTPFVALTDNYSEGGTWVSTGGSFDSILGVPRPTIEEFVNPDNSRVAPIKCKYLTSFSGMLFCANIIDSSSISTQALGYSFAFSLMEEGCSPETFDYSNTVTIGESDEGQIVGISPSSSSIIVLKERATYLVPIGSDGAIGRVVKLSSTVGCSSNKSIGTFDEYSVWLCDRGVYSQSGSSALKELSDPIENIFTDNIYGLDFTKARIARDRFNELVLFYVPKSTGLKDIIFVYSYKFDEWYLYDSISSTYGFYHDGTSLFCNTGSALNKLSASSKNDLGVAIDKYYKSGWEAVGEHSVEKKFNNVLCYSIQYTNKTYNDWKLTVTAENDWNEAIQYICDDHIFSTTARRQFFNLDKTAGYSRRLTFRNNELNQGFYLSGYDIEFMQPQQRIRD